MAVQEAIFFSMFCIGLWFTSVTLTARRIVSGLTATVLLVAALSNYAPSCLRVLRYKQVTAIFGFFSFAFQMLTGMFVPVQTLPKPLRIVGKVYP